MGTLGDLERASLEDLRDRPMDPAEVPEHVADGPALTPGTVQADRPASRVAEPSVGGRGRGAGSIGQAAGAAPAALERTPPLAHHPPEGVAGSLSGTEPDRPAWSGQTRGMAQGDATIHPAREAVEQHAARWNARDREGWLALYSDDVVFEDPVGKAPKPGRSAAEGSVGQLAAARPGVDPRPRADPHRRQRGRGDHAERGPWSTAWPRS